MHEQLLAARRVAEKLRYSGDKVRKTEAARSANIGIKSYFFQNALRLTPEVTPLLYQRVRDVCGRLRIPTNAVEAFVTASSEIQAECYAGASTDCVIRLSSALVDILDEEEFAFVLGHELGHFLLDHGVTSDDHDAQSLESFMRQRAQEISVDRVGLLACGSLSVALRALMKTMSGLNSHYLRGDFGSFIAQLRKPPGDALGVSETATHPSILVRCRALLWFSTEDISVFLAEQGVATKEKLDERVQADLDKYVNGPAMRRIESVREDLRMWMAASGIVKDGRFDRAEQAAFAAMFGNEALNRLKGFLAGMSPAELRRLVDERVAAAEAELRSLLPDSWSTHAVDLRQSIAAFVS